MGARRIVVYLLGAGLAAPVIFRARLLSQQGPIEPRLKPAPPSTQAQDKPRVNLRVDATLVLVPVQVTDKRNRPVTGLNREDFKIFDDAVEQQIASFSKEDDPIALCIVYDVSSSMGGNTKMSWYAANEAIRVADVGDELCAVTLSSQATLAMPLTRDAGSRDIDDKLFEVKGGGTTALLDGVYFALNELKKSKKLKKAMLIISDGLDNNSRYTEREVLNAVKESEVLIYAAGEGGLKSAIGDRQVLPDLIEATGGLFLGDIRRVITDMRNRYILGFSPTDKTRDGRYHRLTLKVTPPKGLPKVSAHWRTGYYAALQ
jgi:Ca-activated chloride channel homolog